MQANVFGDLCLEIDEVEQSRLRRLEARRYLTPLRRAREGAKGSRCVGWCGSKLLMLRRRMAWKSNI
jgi:hypothetical protein